MFTSYNIIVSVAQFTGSGSAAPFEYMEWEHGAGAGALLHLKGALPTSGITILHRGAFSLFSIMNVTRNSSDFHYIIFKNESGNSFSIIIENVTVVSNSDKYNTAYYNTDSYNICINIYKANLKWFISCPLNKIFFLKTDHTVNSKRLGINSYL